MNIRTVFLVSFLLLSISNLQAIAILENTRSADKEVVCFVYHRFGDPRHPSTNVSLEDFEAHLRYLQENGFQVLTFEKAIAYLNSPTPEQKTAVITIDDGYQSFYEKGLPLLEKYKFPATLFINTKTISGSDYMDWKALKDAVTRGIEIGNHTHSHDYFLNLPQNSRYDIFKQEIQLTQRLINEHLDITPTIFAYPYGELDDQMKIIVEASGFVAAAAQNSGVIRSTTDFFRCPRFPMSESYSELKKFITKATMHSLDLFTESPSSCIIPHGETKPVLTLEVANDALQTNQMNCFIQGSECSLKTQDIGNGKIKITIQPTSAITGRRRTLYTLTGKDENGSWHWYSHLWINPKVK